MRYRVMALGLLLSLGRAASAQEAPAPDVAPRRTAAGEREAQRAAALARGRARFFSQQLGFDHGRDDPRATGALPPGMTSLPAVVLPTVRRK